MAYFEWADDMVIDQGPIDADHRQLIGLVNRLHSATALGEGGAMVGALLDELVAYTRAHFAREEQLMAQLNHAQRDEHAAAHRRLLGEVERLTGLHAAGGITTAAQVSMLLRDWLSLHIRREDRALRALLRPRAPGRGALSPAARR